MSLHSGRRKVAPVRGVGHLQNKKGGKSSKSFNINVFHECVKLPVARWQSPKKALICLDLELIKQLKEPGPVMNFGARGKDRRKESLQPGLARGGGGGDAVQIMQ